MDKKKLYLVWNCRSNGKQYVVGQLSKNEQYEFKYCKEIEEALKVGFTPLISFEDVNAVYKSEENLQYISKTSRSLPLTLKH